MPGRKHQCTEPDRPEDLQTLRECGEGKGCNSCQTRSVDISNIPVWRDYCLLTVHMHAIRGIQIAWCATYVRIGTARNQLWSDAQIVIAQQTGVQRYNVNAKKAAAFWPMVH